MSELRERITEAVGTDVDELIERWLPVRGYKGLYEVSSLGRVRSVERRITQSNGAGTTYERVWPQRLLNPTINNHGYRSVHLSKNRKTKRITVHRLVAGAFIPSVPGAHWINHRDGDKLNNTVENLEWVTPQGNTTHAVENGLLPHGKLTTHKVRRIKSLLGRGARVRDVARRFGVAESTISNIKHGYRWAHVEAGNE